jgi:hypothetical protein
MYVHHCELISTTWSFDTRRIRTVFIEKICGIKMISTFKSSKFAQTKVSCQITGLHYNTTSEIISLTWSFSELSSLKNSVVS